MIEKNDWRLIDQMDYLYKETVTYKYYEIRSESWDHDHCEFCTDKFDKPRQKGYATKDDYYWICETCYEDFKNMFQFQLVADRTS